MPSEPPPLPNPNKDRKVVQRRDPKTGRFTSEFAFAPPDLPGGDEFVQRHRGVEPPPLPGPAEPPPLPPAAEPPPLSPESQPAGESSMAAAVGGASQGKGFGPAGMAVGAVAGFLAAEAQKPQAIGSFEGGTVRQEDESIRQLKDLVAITRQTAALGLPVKDAITTNATNSRI